MEFAITFKETRPASHIELVATGDIRARAIVANRDAAVTFINKWLDFILYAEDSEEG